MKIIQRDRYLAFEISHRLALTALVYSWHLSGVHLFRTGGRGAWSRHIQFCAFGYGITFGIVFNRGGWSLLDVFGLHDRGEFLKGWQVSPIVRSDSYHDELARLREQERAG